jgi:hypothetical protein
MPCKAIFRDASPSSCRDLFPCWPLKPNVSPYLSSSCSRTPQIYPACPDHHRASS